MIMMAAPHPIIVPGHVNSTSSVDGKMVCDMFIKSFDSKTATLEKKKYYSHCVETIYSDDVSFGQGICIFIGFVIFTFLLAIGVIIFCQALAKVTDWIGI